jgi:hypothetical protein
MQIDAVSHDEVLMAGMEHRRIDRRHDVDGKIVRADDANLHVGEPSRAFEADAGGAIVESIGFCIPSRTVPGPHEDRVSGSDPVLRDLLAVEARLEVGQLDFFPDVEHAAFQALVVGNRGSFPLASFWERNFTEPIRLRDGRSIETLLHARDLILSLYEVQQQRPFWIYAAELLLAAVDSGDPRDIQHAAYQLWRALTVENMHYRAGRD